MQRICLTKNGMFIIWFVVKILFRCYIYPFTIQNVQIFCGILFIRYNFMTYLQSDVYINKTSQDILSMVWFFKNVICRTTFLLSFMFKIFTAIQFLIGIIVWELFIFAYLISCNGFLNPHCYWWCCYPYAVSVVVIILMDYVVDWFEVFLLVYVYGLTARLCEWSYQMS